MNISIVLPAYNEEKNIFDTLNECVAYLTTDNKIERSEILVIDDGSTDKTNQVVQSYISKSDAKFQVHNPVDKPTSSQKDVRIKLLSHKKNVGYGGALTTGFKESQFEWVFYMDSDQQFRLSEVKQLIDYIYKNELANSNSFIVTGVRAHRQDGVFRSINAKIYNLSLRFLFGIKSSDINCAFKLIPRKFLTDISIISTGATISAELFYLAKRKGIQIVEIPVTHHPRPHGVQTGAKISVVLKAMWAILLLRWKYLF